MYGCKCYIEFDDGDIYCVWIEDIERGTLKILYIVIIDSQDSDLKNMISRRL